MHQYDPVSLRLFVTVCEERNIALAAAREGLVPSAVSKRISAIEERSGARLLDRGRRGVTVTPAGEALWRYARDILQTMERMHAELSDFAPRRPGQCTGIRLNVSYCAVSARRHQRLY